MCCTVLHTNVDMHHVTTNQIKCTFVTLQIKNKIKIIERKSKQCNNASNFSCCPYTMYTSVHAFKCAG